MKKLLVLILSAVMLTTILTACDESASGQPSGGTGTSDVTVSNTDAAVPPNTNAIPAQLDGAYTNNTYYLVIQDGAMRIDDVPYEITNIQTDLFDDEDTPYYYFTFDGKEESFYYDDENEMLMCSIGEEKWSWSSWNKIDIADIPKASSEDEPAEQLGENPFEGKTYRLDGEDTQTLEITKLDMDGNIIEIVVDGTTLEMTDVSTEPYGGDETTYYMGSVDGSFNLRVLYNKAEDKFYMDVFSPQGVAPSFRILGGNYYFVGSESSSTQPDFIGKVYTYTDIDIPTDQHTFTVVSCDENGLITEAKLDENAFSLTDCRLIEGESMEYSTSVLSYKGSFQNGNVNVTMSYYVNPDFFTLNFAYAQYPGFETINGEFK